MQDHEASIEAFVAKKERLDLSLQIDAGKISLQKNTISNRFRYSKHNSVAATGISLSDFDQILSIDPTSRTLDVEGLATYESIVDATLPYGFLPTVSPELKHITVGGATVGIGIESTCFRHGFVHDGLLQAEVLLPDRSIVTCTADNAHSDLFHALPNSYGTLGYILRARIRLIPATPYVQLLVTHFSDASAFLDAMKVATEGAEADFIEGLFFSHDSFYLMTAHFVDTVPYIDDILRTDIFYKLAQEKDKIYLTTKDYIFRYDPEWFWNIPDGPLYSAFRKYAPKRFRNSSFYTKYSQAKEASFKNLLRHDRTKKTEPLIQDWQVPWPEGKALLDFALQEVDLGGRPWAAVPIRTPSSPTLYPIKSDVLYFNLGCYTQVHRRPDKEDFYSTKILDRKCFELGGIKMLYSSTFLSKEEFNGIYNGEEYARLKSKYDPKQNAYGLYDKAVGLNSRSHPEA